MLDFIKLFFTDDKENAFVLPQNETVNINGVEWATRNAGTDQNYPIGKLYTINEALLLENDYWRLPTQNEIMDLSNFNKKIYNTKKLRGTIIYVGDETLFFPWNFIRRHEGFLPRQIGTYWTSSFLSLTINVKIFNMLEIENYIFCSPGDLPPFKAGVRLVKRE